jgi:F420-dependent oxidoreductase-like protein
VRLSMQLSYAGGFKESVDKVVELEKAGLDLVWVAEAYTFDAISQVGYLAARTERLQIGTGIINVYSRTPTLIGMTAAGCDYVSDGRFVLGLGASGPQVVEGFHGIPYSKPMTRITETIDVVRKVLRREVIDVQGETVQIPLPAGQGTGLGKPLKLINRPVRPDVPIWWASLMGKSVEATARVADGWLPIMYYPEKALQVWGAQLAAGAAGRSPDLAPLEISAGGMLAIDDKLTGEAQQKVLDFARPMMALYVGGMGAKGKNFYNDLAIRYGYEGEAAEIQDLYLGGKKDEAAALVPTDWLTNSNLVGSAGFVKERIAAYREAGVTMLQVNPVGPDPVRQIEQLRALVDA